MPPDLERWWRERSWNTLCSIGLFWLVVFLINLLFSKSGEVAQAVGNVLGGALGAIAAIVAVRVTFANQAQLEQQRRENELASIRLALRTEVAMLAAQCLRELADWQDIRRRGGTKDARTALLPPLEVYAAMAGQLGRLTRDEIVHLIGFASTLADLRIVAQTVMEKQNQNPDDQDTVITIVSNACCNAAACLRAIHEPGAEKDAGFIAALDRGCAARAAEREASRANLLAR